MHDDTDESDDTYESGAEPDGNDPLDAGLAAFFGDTSIGAWPATEESVKLPQKIGDYRIVREIGRGAMGIVYLAEQISLRRRVALKLLPASLTRRFDAVTRFRIEASSAARLRHPGIVQVYAIGEADGHHYIAMELIEGSPLQEVIAQLRTEGLTHLNGSRVGLAVAEAAHRVSRDSVMQVQEPETPSYGQDDDSSPEWDRSYIETVCRLIAQVADALQHAHDAGVIHRDVKPSNILVLEDSRAVLTDFGLARAEDLPSVTRSDVYIGTPHYSSPEQARAERDKIDHRSDIFSLGVTLYELLTLQLPFDGKTTREVLDKIVDREPLNPRRLNKKLPRDLATILLKAMAKERRARYANASAFAADLRAFLALEPIAARRTSIVSKSVKFVRRHRAASVAVVVLALGWTGWEIRAALQPWEFDVHSGPSGATVFLEKDLAGILEFVRGESKTPCTIKGPSGTYNVRLEKVEGAQLLVALVQLTIDRDNGQDTFLLSDIREPLRRGESIDYLATLSSEFKKRVLAFLRSDHKRFLDWLAAGNDSEANARVQALAAVAQTSADHSEATVAGELCKRMKELKKETRLSRSDFTRKFGDLKEPDLLQQIEDLWRDIREALKPEKIDKLVFQPRENLRKELRSCITTLLRKRAGQETELLPAQPPELILADLDGLLETIQTLDRIDDRDTQLTKFQSIVVWAYRDIALYEKEDPDIVKSIRDAMNNVEYLERPDRDVTTHLSSLKSARSILSAAQRAFVDSTVQIGKRYIDLQRRVAGAKYPNLPVLTKEKLSAMLDFLKNASEAMEQLNSLQTPNSLGSAVATIDGLKVQVLQICSQAVRDAGGKIMDKCSHDRKKAEDRCFDKAETAITKAPTREKLDKLEEYRWPPAFRKRIKDLKSCVDHQEFLNRGSELRDELPTIHDELIAVLKSKDAAGATAKFVYFKERSALFVKHLESRLRNEKDAALLLELANLYLWRGEHAKAMNRAQSVETTAGRLLKGKAQFAQWRHSGESKNGPESATDSFEAIVKDKNVAQAHRDTARRWLWTCRLWSVAHPDATDGEKSEVLDSCENLTTHGHSYACYLAALIELSLHTSTEVPIKVKRALRIIKRCAPASAADWITADEVLVTFGSYQRAVELRAVDKRKIRVQLTEAEAYKRLGLAYKKEPNPKTPQGWRTAYARSILGCTHIINRYASPLVQRDLWYGKASFCRALCRDSLGNTDASLRDLELVLELPNDKDFVELKGKAEDKKDEINKR